MVSSLAAAAPRLGSKAEVIIDQQQGRPETVLEVRTDPALSKNSEMMVYLFPLRAGRTAGMTKRLVPPRYPGLYRLAFTFPETGEWRISFRYGLGLDLYYASITQRVEPDVSHRRVYPVTFMGDLDASAPRYVQPLGFSVFGLIVGIAVVLVTAVLRWLKRQPDAVSLE